MLVDKHYSMTHPHETVLLTANDAECADVVPPGTVPHPSNRTLSSFDLRLLIWLRICKMSLPLQLCPLTLVLLAQDIPETL